MRQKNHLQNRLVKIEELYQSNKITNTQLEVLDALARAEAGLLDYEEALEEFLRK